MNDGRFISGIMPGTQHSSKGVNGYDYFHSEKSINPTDTTAFYRLIRNSVAITIATEPECVEALRLDGSNVTASMLLERLKEHIKAAMMANAKTLSE